MKNINVFLSFWSCVLFVSFFIFLNAGATLAVACSQDSDCPVTGKCYIETIGSKTISECVTCTNDSHCSGTLNKCRIASNPRYNECVECKNQSDCGEGEFCDNYRCYVCRNNSHCSGRLNVCIRDRSHPKGMCVDCTTNIDCGPDQTCDRLTHTCKAKFQAPEPQLSPEKYKFDKRKNPRQLETSPQTQQQLKQQQLQQPYIDQKNVNPRNALPKDTKQIN